MCTNMGMCNLYNITTSQAAIRDLTGASRDLFGNLQENLNVYPDYPAPIIRHGSDGVRELVSARWGMPTPPKFVKGSADSGVTNIRNVKSPHWRRWLGVENRCVVPSLRSPNMAASAIRRPKSCRSSGLRSLRASRSFSWRAFGQAGMGCAR